MATSEAGKWARDTALALKSRRREGFPFGFSVADMVLLAEQLEQLGIDPWHVEIWTSDTGDLEFLLNDPFRELVELVAADEERLGPVPPEVLAEVRENWPD